SLPPVRSLPGGERLGAAVLRGRGAAAEHALAWRKAERARRPPPHPLLVARRP
ncbi:hypothetical protein EMIHUDRAFT_364104, partial [Emiliania huxleyi CCMP1516]|uniref:Uncharacterized protein n=2 Tax=Emiliania huxleyi TaxID=2903 RepID=A0A0D3KBA2_EMIH1